MVQGLSFSVITCTKVFFQCYRRLKCEVNLWKNNKCPRRRKALCHCLISSFMRYVHSFNLCEMDKLFGKEDISFMSQNNTRNVESR